MMEVTFLYQDAKTLLRSVSTPREPSVARMLAMLRSIELTVARMRKDVYSYMRAQGQGPREVCPTSPAEDDPA